jgi:hypothetical protein
MRFFVFVLFFLNTLLLNAQVNLEGVLNSKSGHQQAGDTIILTGAYQDPETQILYYYKRGTGEKIAAENITLQLDGVDFWEVQQFYYISYKVIEKGWEVEKRDKLEQQTLDLLARLEAEKKIYNDKFLEDYLQRLIQRIHYPKIWKGRDQNLVIKILNSDQKICYGFDNGTVLITTQLIAQSLNERDLFRILAEVVAHILLDSNIENLDSGSESDYARLGAIYTASTKKRIQSIAGKYLSYYERTVEGEPYSNEFDFLNSVAGVIGYTAWQEYYSNHFQAALELVERLMQANIANSTDYLLKAKIYPKIVDTPEANRQSISYLKKAASLTDQQLPEIYSELGVLQLREKLYAEARISFTEYYKLVSAVQDDEQMKWALKMINLCDVYLKENTAETSQNP